MKTSAWMRIFFGVLIAIILTCVLISSLNGGWNVPRWNFWMSSYWYDDADSYTTGPTSLDAAEIQSIHLHWIGGEVKIQTSDTDQVTLKEVSSSSLGSEQQLRWRVKDGILTIQPQKVRQFGMMSHLLNKTLILTLPNTMELSSFTADVVSAELSADALTAQEVDINTVSGNLTFQNLISDTFSYETVSGDVRLQGIIAVLHGQSVSGTVSFSSDVCPQTVDLETVSGKAELALPENSGFTAELDTVSGHIRENFGGTEGKKMVRWGDGRLHYTFESVSGNVVIDKNPAR